MLVTRGGLNREKPASLFLSLLPFLFSFSLSLFDLFVTIAFNLILIFKITQYVKKRENSARVKKLPTRAEPFSGFSLVEKGVCSYRLKIYLVSFLSEKEESHKALTTIIPKQSISCKSQNRKNEDLHERHGWCLDFQRRAESSTCN